MEQERCFQLPWKHFRNETQQEGEWQHISRNWSATSSNVLMLPAQSIVASEQAGPFKVRYCQQQLLEIL